MISEVKSIKSIFWHKMGIGLSQLLFKFEPTFQTEIPIKLVKDYSNFHKKWLEKTKNNHFDNKKSLCISHFHVKDKKIYLNFCAEDYAVRQTISETLGSLPPINQDFILSEINNNRSKLPLAYKVNIIIITHDAKLIWIKRGNRVSTNKNKIEFGVSKGVIPDDYSAKSFQPLNTVIRASQDELGLKLDKKEIINKEVLLLKELYLNREIFSLGLIAVLNFRQLDEKYNAENIIKQANEIKDNWEFSDIGFIDFSKKAIVSFIKENEPKITNYSLHYLINQIDSL